VEVVSRKETASDEADCNLLGHRRISLSPYRFGRVTPPLYGDDP
jgi:hypothetical protein